MLVLMKGGVILTAVAEGASFEHDGQVTMPAYEGWSSEDDQYYLLKVEEPDPVPEDQQVMSQGIDLVDGVPKFINILGPKIPVRPMVRKSVVQARIIEAGKMTQAYQMLISNAIYFARWFAPDRPEVYCDDPDAVGLVVALGLNPAVILAPEE